MTTASRKPPIGRFYELQQEVSIPEDYVLTSKIRIKAPTRTQMIAFRNAPPGEESDRAFLGDAADAVLELYADRPEQEWLAFTQDVYKHFAGPGADDEGKSGQSSE
jgi:hypothetical protein